jgi:hypothetical protein
MKTLVVEHRLDHPVGRRIAVDSGHEIGAERLAERRNILECLGIGLPDQFAGHRRMVEPLGQSVDHGRLQRVVMQDGRIDEGRELGLAPYRFFRLAADARPHRIDGIEGRLGLLLRHQIVSPLNGENAASIILGSASAKAKGGKNRGKNWGKILGHWPETGSLADKLGHWPHNFRV